MKKSAWSVMLTVSMATLCEPARAAERPVQSSQAAAPAVERTLEYGALFGSVALYMAVHTPSSVVIFLSGDGGWHLGVVDMARQLVEQGATMAGGHHFGGNYEALAAAILKHAGIAAGSATTVR